MFLNLGSASMYRTFFSEWASFVSLQFAHMRCIYSSLRKAIVLPRHFIPCHVCKLEEFLQILYLNELQINKIKVRCSENLCKTLYKLLSKVVHEMERTVYSRDFHEKVTVAWLLRK
jgi:hypothetical protein